MHYNSMWVSFSQMQDYQVHLILLYVHMCLCVHSLCVCISGWYQGSPGITEQHISSSSRLGQKSPSLLLLPQHSVCECFPYFLLLLSGSSWCCESKYNMLTCMLTPKWSCLKFSGLSCFLSVLSVLAEYIKTENRLVKSSIMWNIYREIAVLTTRADVP